MLTYSPATRDEVEHLLLVSEEGKNTRFLKSSHNLWYRFKNYTKAPPLAAREGDDIVALIFATFNKDGYTNLYEIVTMEGHEGKGYGSKVWEYFLDYAVNQKQSKRLKISCTPSSVTWHMRNGLVFWAVDPSGSLRSDQPLFATRGEQLEFRAKAIVTPSIAKPTNPRVIEQLKKEAPESHGFGKKKMSATEEAIAAVGECWLRDALYEDASLESLFD